MFCRRTPTVYEAARAEGAQREHDRIVAHLALGEKSGAMPTALRAIESGAGLTAELVGVYLTAGRNRADVRARQSECDEADQIVENLEPPPSGYRDDFGEAVFERLQKLVGTGEA